MKLHTPKLITMMSQLIATPSVSCAHVDLDMSNEAVIDKLANWLSDCGFAIEKQQVLPGKFNLIASIGQGSEGLILSGHTDTVPYDDHLWQSDPFAPTERDGRLYGLGSCDMKSFLAMAISASQAFKKEQYQRPLTIIATADEETTMSGARMLAEEGKLLGRYCVIGEPTGLKPIRQHKGIMMESIRFIGSSGHSSNPELGNNALEAMHAFMFDLINFRDRIQREHHNPAFEVPAPTLNLGHIHGGDSPNRICGECELHIDLRPLPGMQLQELRQQIRGLAQQTAKQRGLEVKFEMLFEGTPALDTDEASLLNRFLEQATEQSSGVVAFGTEAPFYNSMGCETIVMGPGSIDQAHQPDEFLPLAQVEPTVDLLTRLIQRFCIQPE